MKTFYSSLCIVFIVIQNIYGLYEDQIGKFDWYVACSLDDLVNCLSITNIFNYKLKTT